MCKIIHKRLLPKANVACEGYVFTCVCHSVHRGVCPIVCWDTTPPGKADLPSPTGRADPPSPPPAGQTPPHAVHAGGYGQQEGGMHPTGMQSC